MRYNVYFSRLNNEKLRALLIGDGATEPITGIAHVPRWVFDAVRNIAREDDKRMSEVFADAVREYVLRRGFRRPKPVFQDEQAADAAEGQRDSLFIRLFRAIRNDVKDKRKQ